MWTSTLVSGLGDGVVLVAVPLYAATLTDNAVVISGLATAAMLPWLLVGLQAGVLADRADRRRLMPMVEIFRADIIALLALALWADWHSLIVLYVVVFLLGCAQTAFSAAGSAELPRLVRDDQLGAANGYLFAAEVTTEQTIGQALGGFVFAAAALSPFTIDAGTYLASAALLLIALPHRDAPPPTDRPQTTRAAIAEAMRDFRGDRLMRLLALAIGIMAMCQAMVMAPFVLYALGPVGLTETGFGILLAIAAIGAVVGGLIADRIDRRFGPASTLTWCAVGAGLSYLLLATFPNVFVAGVALSIEGFVVAVGNVSSMTLRQRIAPPGQLGASSNIVRFFIYATVPVAALIGGVLAEGISLRAPMVVGGALQIPAILLLAPRLKHLVDERVASFGDG